MRTIDDVNYSLNRTPANRRIYAEQQIDWFYTELLKAQRGKAQSRPLSESADYWRSRIVKAERDLAEAHERHLKACAELGPARLMVERLHGSDHRVTLRDAAGFVRERASGFWTAQDAMTFGRDVATRLGLEVE